MLSVISVCSGAGGMDLGFTRAGFRTVALCEWLPWLRELLAKRFPGVRCWPDLATLDPAELPPATVIIGGTPCQDLSVTGLRAGLEGTKSRLFWDFIRVRNATGTEWAVWENVEGALSSNRGLDFACVLGAFVGADVDVPTGGWPGAGVVAGPWGGCVWRVLDAQHFGVPQRRRRVFVVGRLGGPCPPEVLFEPEGSDRDSRARRQARQEDPRTFGVSVAGSLGACTGGARTTDLDGHGAYVASALTAGGPARLDDQAVAQLVAVPGRAPSDANRMRTADELAGRVDRPVTVLGSAITHTLTAEGHDASEDGTAGRGTPIVGGLRSAFDPRPDSRRLSACGNGVASVVTEWIGGRLAHIIEKEMSHAASAA